MLATEHLDRRIQFPCPYLPTGWMIFDTAAAAVGVNIQVQPPPLSTEHGCVLWEIIIITVTRQGLTTIDQLYIDNNQLLVVT